ncbi:hypothetical protein NQ314_007037 [Rhamnusium bicolor]|uniref:Uncharacterized protein n=1 Tax=Rhamnusium bicolor TaxID=1586634 RepID=A0AAV8YSY9_9CUCU|nr:hypothetical protein NQ314_007037 [Rhamnusium bicolor]
MLRCLETNSTLEEFCLKETDVTEDLVKSYKDEPEKEPTEDIYCYVHCIFTNMGLIDEEGNVVVKAFMEIMPNVEEECLKKAPKIQECNDMASLKNCSI